jgi:hypothetical protein
MESANERKMKEFNPTYVQYQADAPKMHKRTSSAIEIKPIESGTLNPREKKIVEQFPNMTKDDLDRFVNKPINSNSRNAPETINKANYMTAKTTLINSLHSNIFHDPV